MCNIVCIGVTSVFGKFEWDHEKELENIDKHGVDFKTAAQAFADPWRIISVDEAHSEKESRYFCLGAVRGQILTVRFTLRGKRVRLIGAGYWRKERAFCVKENR